MYLVVKRQTCPVSVRPLDSTKITVGKMREYVKDEFVVEECIKGFK